MTKNTTGQLGQCVKCDYLEYCKEYYSKTAGGMGASDFQSPGTTGILLGDFRCDYYRDNLTLLGVIHYALHSRYYRGTSKQWTYNF